MATMAVLGKINDLLLLSGIGQEETILLLASWLSEFLRMREVLFLERQMSTLPCWEGHKYTKGKAEAASGINEY